MTNPLRKIPVAYRWVVLAVVLALVAYRVRMNPESTASAREYQVAAGRYREYAGAYAYEGKGSLRLTTGFGDPWDAYTEKVLEDVRDPAHDAAFRSQQSAHYDRLRARYEHAAADPLQVHLSVEPPSWP